MVGFFPDPYPDELLYSVCARYHHRVRYRAHRSTAQDLFGARVVAAIDLPSSLSRLIAALPPGHRYSVDQLIDNHTLLLFYAPFLPPERVTRLRRSMAEERSGGQIYWQIGTILKAKIRLEFLRYCTACVREDRRQYGEAYWRRVHQTPGVIVCPHHSIPLSASSLYIHNRGQHRKFSMIDQVMKEPTAPPPVLEDRDLQAHLWIAQEAQWLLNNHPGANSPKELRGRYHGLLFARGLASYGGVVWLRELQEEFRQFYSEQLLRGLYCQLDGPWNWLVRLVKPGIWARHPVHHLLLMRFLGCSAAEFFQQPTSPQPFGAGPWPCLNPVCEHDQRPSIEKFKVRRMEVGDQVKKAADFRCACGFTYSRPFPDSSTGSDADNYRVMSCGPIWEEELRRLYHSGKYTRLEMAEKLGVKPNTIMRKVMQIRRGQEASESREQAKQARALARAEARDSANELKRATYREKWLQAMKSYPAASRSQLNKIEPTAYSWLTVYDREWFEAASPPPRTNPGPPPIVDWKQRDSELATTVRTAAERLRQAPGRPLRVSKFAIAQEIGEVAVIYKQAHHIPKTTAVLKEVSESLDDWAVRRIQWAAKNFHQENRQPAVCGQILARANVTWKRVGVVPIVKAALRTAALEFGLSDLRLGDKG